MLKSDNYNLGNTTGKEIVIVEGLSIMGYETELMLAMGGERKVLSVTEAVALRNALSLWTNKARAKQREKET